MSRARDVATQVAGDGWLLMYLEYAKTLTHAPAMYHIATGLGCLSTAVGSKVWWRGYGGTETWPNLYQLILGPTGTGKTTAMKIGERMLRHAIPGSIYPDETSQEAFINGLAANPTVLMSVEEFSTLLSMMQRSYMSGFKETLTKLFDPQEQFVRKLRGQSGQGETITIHRPSLSILGASTTDWLVSHLEEVDFRSGFMPRFLLWPQDVTDNEDEPNSMGDVNERTEANLKRGLSKLSRMERAHITFDPAARRHLERFIALRDTEAALAETEDMRGMVKRIGAYCGKISTLLAVADSGVCGEYTVDVETAKRTTTLVAWLIDAAAELFERQIVFEKFEKELQRLMKWIPETGVERSVLLKKSKKPASEFSRMLDTLRQRSEITTDRVRPEGAIKTSEYIYRIYPNQGVRSNGEGTESELKGTVGELSGNHRGTIEDPDRLRLVQAGREATGGHA